MQRKANQSKEKQNQCFAEEGKQTIATQSQAMQNKHSKANHLVKLQRRHRDMVKNGQKLKKGTFFLIKNPYS